MIKNVKKLEFIYF